MRIMKIKIYLVIGKTYSRKIQTRFEGEDELYVKII